MTCATRLGLASWLVLASLAGPGLAAEAQSPAPAEAPAAAETKAPPREDKAASEREAELWAATRRSGKKDDFAVFLTLYPDGAFSKLAKAAMERLETGRPEQAPADVREAPSSLETEAALALDPRRVRQLQRHLQRAGYDPGPADGAFRPETRLALGKWQLARGIGVTSYLNRPQYDLMVSEAPDDFRRPVFRRGPEGVRVARRMRGPRIVRVRRNVPFLFWVGDFWLGPIMGPGFR